MLDALLGTFDLDLITPGTEGREEYGWMYWFISRIASDRLRMGQQADDRKPEGPGTWRPIWARAWAEIGNALFLVRKCIERFPSEVNIWPWLTEAFSLYVLVNRHSRYQMSKRRKAHTT